ncbi:hypothetical protein RclHR1_01510006 [Rhizophagus clarus]|uniref:Uncharacterized protein n=1 Tax=Rhizophagus clarus TaxID=94130 RepID=A0A2Z6QG54_9GLOM|nr:hypothetical protein RclHR1_01510006 [Rhizophagus clarus]GET02556.1 hypothetical protein RCL_e2854_RclHR1_01510006 [Rhizophagus clarus]
MSAYHSHKFPDHNNITLTAKVSQYLSPYNKTFYKVIKHLPLSRLRRIPDALPYIPIREHIIAQDRHINPPVNKKPKIPNQNDLSNFNPISDELLTEDSKDKFAEILSFIPRHHILIQAQLNFPLDLHDCRNLSTKEKRNTKKGFVDNVLLTLPMNKLSISTLKNFN